MEWEEKNNLRIYWVMTDIQTGEILGETRTYPLKYEYIQSKNDYNSWAATRGSRAPERCIFVIYSFGILRPSTFQIPIVSVDFFCPTTLFSAAILDSRALGRTT